MNQPTNIFPLLFTLERVENGYVLKSKEETTGLSGEAKYKKEVVIDNNIDARIGHLLHLDTMKKEVPITFYVEAATESTYKLEGEDQTDNELMSAKVKFYQFKGGAYKDESILALQIKESGTFEIYGASAEKLALNNNLNLIRMGGVHALRFPDTKEGKKQLGSFRPPITLLEVSEKDILNWYHSHDVSNIEG